MADRVWVKYGDQCKRFPLVDGRLDLDCIARTWNLDPTQLFVASEYLSYKEGKSVESIEQIREWLAEEEQDGEHRNTALVLEGKPASSDVGGITAVELRDVLKSIQLGVLEMRTADASRTRSASNIGTGDLLALRSALKVVVTYEDINGNRVGSDILGRDDRFWNQLYERQQKDRYIAEVKKWVPEGDIVWVDVDGHNIRRAFPNGPFPVSGQNDQLVHLRGLGIEQGALLGLELKRKVLTWKGLRQAEVNFYLWSDLSLFPFVQIVSDMQKGGVAMYCRSREPDRIQVVQVVLQNMHEVRSFTQKMLSHPPGVHDARYADVPFGDIEPPRKRFRPLDVPEKEGKGGGNGGKAAGSSSYLENGLEDPSPSQLLLWKVGAKLLDDDVANMADLQAFDLPADDMGSAVPVSVFK